MVTSLALALPLASVQLPPAHPLLPLPPLTAHVRPSSARATLTAVRHHHQRLLESLHRPPPLLARLQASLPPAPLSYRMAFSLRSRSHRPSQTSRSVSQAPSAVRLSRRQRRLSASPTLLVPRSRRRSSRSLQPQLPPQQLRRHTCAQKAGKPSR